MTNSFNPFAYLLICSRFDVKTYAIGMNFIGGLGLSYDCK